MIASNIEVLIPGDPDAGDFDLISLEEVKAFFNITSTTDDARIQKLITFNSLVVADMCDRVFALEQVAETFFNIDLETGLCLNRYPVVSVEGVTVGGGTISDFTVENESGIIRASGFADEVVVTYTAGYDLPDGGPKALALATIEGIRQSYYYGARDPMIQSITDNNSGSIRWFPPPGVSRTGGGGGAAAAPRPLSPTAMGLIFPFTKRPLA